MFPICRPGDLPPHIVHGVGYQKVMLLYDRCILSFPTFLYNGFPLTCVPVYSLVFFGLVVDFSNMVCIPDTKIQEKLRIQHKNPMICLFHTV